MYPFMNLCLLYFTITTVIVFKLNPLSGNMLDCSNKNIRDIKNGDEDAGQK